MIVVPRADLTIDVVGPDQRRMAADLMRVGTSDDLGCAALLSDLTPSGDPLSAVFAPTVPLAGVICEYSPPAFGQSKQWSDGSRVLRPAEIRPLLAFLNGLTTSTSTQATTADLSDRYQLLQPSGATTAVAVSLGGNGLLVTDGHRHVGVDYASTSCFYGGCTPSPLPDVYSGYSRR